MIVTMKKQVFALTFVVVVVSGCGGGGSSGTQTTNPAPVAPVAPVAPAAPAYVAANLQTNVPQMTYAAGSAELEFASNFADFRTKQGLGALIQRPELDISASNHLKYILRNDSRYGGNIDFSTNDPITGRSFFHIETLGNPLFTGNQESDRAKSANYNSTSVGEEVTFGGGKGGLVALNSLISTIYHRAGLMFQSPRDFGISAGTDLSQTFVLEAGVIGQGQSNASDYLGVYPGDNQVNVGLHAGVEVPNPFPDLSLYNTDYPTKTGYPISVAIKEFYILDVTEFTVTEMGQSAALDARLMTKDNDPNHYLGSNIAFLTSKTPYKPNTTYQVSFKGKSNGFAIAKYWIFTTQK